MPRTPRRAAPWVALLAAATWAGQGCGDATEGRVQAAQARLAEARAEVETARERVVAAEAGVEMARAELEGAREALRDGELRLAEAETHVDLRASDAVLFRRVQGRLLEDEALSEVAIQADVQRGVVTLRGQVPSAALGDRARRVAEATPGVTGVESQITVREAPKQG